MYLNHAILHNTFSPETSISEIFAVMRQWVPQIQQNLETFVNQVCNCDHTVRNLRPVLHVDSLISELYKCFYDYVDYLKPGRGLGLTSSSFSFRHLWLHFSKDCSSYSRYMIELTELTMLHHFTLPDNKTRVCHQ